MSSSTSSGDQPDSAPRPAASGADSSVSGLDPAASTLAAESSPAPDLSSPPASNPEPADAPSAAPASPPSDPGDAVVTPAEHAAREGEPAPQSITAPSGDATDPASAEAQPVAAAAAVAATDATPHAAPVDPDLPPLPASFDELPLPDALRRAIARLGWQKPSPVQALSYEPLVAGRDVLVQSHTGSGKTGAFCVPWLAARFDARPAAQTGVQLLVLLPTRELAKQVCDELRRLAQETPVDVLPVYGGTPMNPQLAALRAGVHAVVGTPGRILDHIRRRSLDLSKVATVVLDECDEMLSMGFLEDIRAILDQITSKHQTALFSATIPQDVDRIARRYMSEPQSIQLSGDMVAAAEIEHAYYLVNSAIKTRDLLDLVMVEDPARGIVFCNTREETKLVASVLRREGYHAEELSSDLNQTQRERVMKAMREHKIRFLVATDVAARGIDISHVTHVINYSFPESAEVYVHRTGRTGRAGRTGTALSLISPREIGNFYYLKLQYPSITFHERQAPPAEQLAAERTEFKLDGISKRFPELVSPEWVLLARSLMADPRGERVIALLLERAMRAAPRPEPIIDIDAENAAAAVEGEQPAAVEPEARPTGPGEVIEREARDLREHREAREPRERFGDRERGDRNDRGDRRDRRDRPRDRRDRDRFGERDRGDRPRDGERDRFADRGDRPRDGERDRFADRPRDDRPRDDRPRDDRPRDGERDRFADRPRDERPRDDRPRDDRARDADRERFAERPRDDRPRDGQQGPEGEGTREFSEGRDEGRRRRDRRDRRRDRDDRGPRGDRHDNRPPRTDAPAAIPATTVAAGEPAAANTPVIEAVPVAPFTPPPPGQIPLTQRGRLGDRGKFLERLAAAATAAAAPPSIADAGESHPAAGELETGEGRRKRRRKRRRGRRDDLDTATAGEAPQTSVAPPTADADLGDDDDDDDSADESAGAASPASEGAEGPDGRRRRRRRRRGRDTLGEARPAPTPPPPPAIVPVPPPRRLGQDEIVIDIDENELAVVNDEFGEIEDEFDEFALMDRRQAVIETLQEEVELEDLSTRDAAANLPIEDDADADDGEDDDETEAEAEAPTSEATAEPTVADAPSKKKRRRRRKKAAPLVTPELTAPPHKDFWEVWAGKYTYHDFEDDKFVSPNPVPDEPEEPPVPADRPSARPAPRSEPPRDRPRRSEPPPRRSEPPRAPPPSRPAVEVEDGDFIKVALNLGRTHGHKAATIRGLLRDQLGLEGRSVRDLTVRDADTLLRIPASELTRVQADLQGRTESGVPLALQPAEDEADLRAPQPEDLGALAVAAVAEVVAEPEAAGEAPPPAQADDAGTT